MQSLDVLEQCVQLIEARLADAARNVTLRFRPSRFRSGERIASGSGERKLARSLVDARRNLDEAASGERIEVAGERSAIEQHRGRERADRHRRVMRERAQHAELRGAQSGRGERIVVEVRDRAARATKARAGTGRHRGTGRAVLNLPLHFEITR